MANSILTGRSRSPFGETSTSDQLIAVSQKIDPTVPVILTTAGAPTGATNVIRKMTQADITAQYKVSGTLAGIFGYSPYSIYTDASGYATVNVVPPGPAASAMPQLPLASYASSIDADSVTGTTQAPFYSFTQPFLMRAASSGTVTGTLTGTGGAGSLGLLTVTALGTATVLTPGALVTGTGIPAGTFIASYGTGTGGAGTYNLTAAVTTETSETITVYLQPVTVTQGLTMEQSFGFQYNNADGSFLMDFSASGASIVGYVNSVNEQDPYYNLLSTNCLVGGLLLQTFNQAVTNVIYTT